MNSFAIEAFLAIVYHGSLTEAANSLFISQSTLSHRLADLEKEVGVKLIERSRGVRTLSLTDDGKQFIAIAKRWEQLAQDIKMIKHKKKRIELIIGAVDALHAYVFPPLYKALREQIPEISIRLKTHSSTELYFQMERGEIDIAFPLINMPMRNIVVEEFYTEPRVVLIKEEAHCKVHGAIDLEDANPALEIFFEDKQNLDYNDWYQCWKGEKDYPFMQVDTATQLFPLMDRVGSWTIVPLSIAKDFVSKGPFSYYHLTNAPPKRVCYKIQSSYPRGNAKEGIEILNRYIEVVIGRNLYSGT